MMPELGKYAGSVIGSYAASLLLIAAVVVLTVWQARRVRADLREVESRQGGAE